MSRTSTITERAFDAVADTDRTGGLNEFQQDAEPGNFFRHAASLSMTKTADGLNDPKLVLSWLLTSLGAPAFWIGLLVPVREAGALLPQLFTAPRIHAMERRKWAWAGGSAVQGLAALGTVWAGLSLDGTAAGITIVALLGILALARSVCSVSYKDILGKTVGKTRRGTVTGLASSLSSAAVIAFALVLMTGVGDRFTVVVAAIALAGALWLIAAALFSTLKEGKSDTKKPEAPFRAALEQLSLLKTAPELRLFILSRGLLVGTALAPPFLVVMASDAGQEAFQQLGALVLASSAAAFLSSYVWGRLADRSSRQVLILSGIAGGAALALAVVFDLSGLMGTVWAAPLVLFGLMLAYNGVRQGRSTYLVDMGPSDKRAEYTAVSNTVIGVILLASGLFGAVAANFGAVWTVALFAAMSFAGAATAFRLSEVQAD
ncbi:MFS transporter [Alphaproteobacteria bacterium GH1-50]|uniref:MFS transporter n=1 Tax=Kangsaoukella pontilimi TaxID=2691042 RepID=A0A7C9IH58_9RHOB|nr:MFS transporter [Kangsaoukella pontilimi]MXQ08808.1 MFS transporter [Kangsaoukella pontilimi]